MAYPTNNVHRRGRRNLGAGQALNLPPISIVSGVAGTATQTNTATFTFSAPVVLNGVPPIALSGSNTFISGTQLSSTTIKLLNSGTGPTLVGQTWTAPANVPQLTGFQGQGVGGANGTF